MADLFDEDFIPTPFRNARAGLAQRMASKGRMPSGTGDFLTRLGAPLTARDSAGAATAALSRGGMTDSASWNSFFTKSQADTKARFGFSSLAPSLVPTTRTDSASMARTWSGLPKVPAASDYLRAAVGTATSFSEGILGRGVPAGLSFTGGRYQTPGTVGRVDSPSTAFIERLKRDNQALKSGPSYFLPPSL